MSVKFVNADALETISKYKGEGVIITSIPDMSELGMTDLGKYSFFFCCALTACIEASKETPLILYQTDRKIDGILFSKAATVLHHGLEHGMDIMWHKIIVRRGYDKVDLMKPGYSHMIAMGYKDKGIKPGRASPDVIEFTGALYDNGMDYRATNQAILYAKKYSSTIIDPFCGKGTVPIMADDLGLDGIGIDIDEAQCKAAAITRRRGLPYKATDPVQWGPLTGRLLAQS